MHPAYSVILFTTASGAGYGLLIWLSIFGALGLVPAERWFGFTAFGLGLALVTAGLLSSTFHLGHPERAWRAFSQWRSSWLSREGVMAVFTYIPLGLAAIGWVFWESADGAWAVAAWVGAAAAAVTVYCTGMIYASLRTIPQWNDPLVTPIYIALALATGAVSLNLLTQLFGLWQPWMAMLCVALLAVALAMKLAYWHGRDAAPKVYSAGSATGLGRFGKVRMLEQPHSQANFVMREMGFKVARKHATRLRRLSVLLGFAVPLAASLVMLISGPEAGVALALLAFVTAGVGVVVERWLFFATAQHIVTLFYGADAA